MGGAGGEGARMAGRPGERTRARIGEKRGKLSGIGQIGLESSDGLANRGESS